MDRGDGAVAHPKKDVGDVLRVDAERAGVARFGAHVGHRSEEPVAVVELVNEVERRRGNVEGMIDEAIERTLKQLRLPSRHDIDRINERLDRLTAELKRSNGRAPSKTKVQRRR